MRVKIRDEIREWYISNKRPLPWRDISDPYRVWVSEIILQQTRVMQGMDYYHRFLKTFPDLESLAKADEEAVLKVWEGLGYYSRARNMHAAAKYIFKERDGIFPSSYEELLKMKGVGSYTAAAISSIVFHEPRAVVDGNVHRVISRLFGIDEPAGTCLATSRIRTEASGLLDPNDPGNHNQAMMELGALICTPSTPDCSACPLQEVCMAYQLDRVADFPVRSKPLKRRKRYFHYLLILDRYEVWLGRRKGKDIWEGLYEFPLIETSRPFSAESLMRTKEWTDLFTGAAEPVSLAGAVWGPVKHVLSHQDIFAKFYVIHVPGAFTLKGYIKVSMDQVDRYPLPKLILNYLAT